MSDTENKIDNNTAIKSDDAPYMKKDSKPSQPSSKSNLVIPLILLLVSAIVIVATFYENEHNVLIAQDNAAAEQPGENDNVAATEAINTVETDALPGDEQNTSSTTDSTTDNTDTTPVAHADTETPAVLETTTVGIDTAESTENISSPSTAPAQPALANDSVITLTADADQRRAHAQPGYGAHQHNRYANPPLYQQARQQAMALSQERMKQRRAAYVKEMQARRQHDKAAWQAAMKAQQERRTEIANVQKAVFQRIEQNRIESRQRMEEMHKRISQMHEEIHQMMRESRPQKKSSAPVQIQSPSIEQM